MQWNISSSDISWYWCNDRFFNSAFKSKINFTWCCSTTWNFWSLYACTLLLGFLPEQAASIGIIGGADGPTAIFLASKLAPELVGAIAVSAYSYMALVPVIQPPIMKLLTTDKERIIRMKPPRSVSKT